MLRRYLNPAYRCRTVSFHPDSNRGAARLQPQWLSRSHHHSQSLLFQKRLTATRKRNSSSSRSARATSLFSLFFTLFFSVDSVLIA